MWKVTFTQKGYVVGVFYNKAATRQEAIESAMCCCVNSYDSARAEWLDDAA